MRRMLQSGEIFRHSDTFLKTDKFSTDDHNRVRVIVALPRSVTSNHLSIAIIL